ncbi:hypothetical protein ACFLY1_00700 [Patescibacteria group bacterium]
MNNYAYVDALFCRTVIKLMSDYLRQNRKEMQGGIRIDYSGETISDWSGPPQCANDFGIDD